MPSKRQSTPAPGHPSYFTPIPDKWLYKMTGAELQAALDNVYLLQADFLDFSVSTSSEKVFANKDQHTKDTPENGKHHLRTGLLLCHPAVDRRKGAAEISGSSDPTSRYAMTRWDDEKVVLATPSGREVYWRLAERYKNYDLNAALTIYFCPDDKVRWYYRRNAFLFERGYSLPLPQLVGGDVAINAAFADLSKIEDSTAEADTFYLVVGEMDLEDYDSFDCGNHTVENELPWLARSTAASTVTPGLHVQAETFMSVVEGSGKTIWAVTNCNHNHASYFYRYVAQKKERGEIPEFHWCDLEQEINSKKPLCLELFRMIDEQRHINSYKACLVDDTSYERARGERVADTLYQLLSMFDMVIFTDPTQSTKKHIVWMLNRSASPPPCPLDDDTWPWFKEHLRPPVSMQKVMEEIREHTDRWKSRDDLEPLCRQIFEESQLGSSTCWRYPPIQRSDCKRNPKSWMVEKVMATVTAAGQDSK